MAYLSWDTRDRTASLACASLPFSIAPASLMVDDLDEAIHEGEEDVEMEVKVDLRSIREIRLGSAHGSPAWALSGHRGWNDISVRAQIPTFPNYHR